MDRKKPSFWHAQLVVPITVARRDLRNPVTGTASWATKANGIDRLPRSYLYRPRPRIGSPLAVSILVAIKEADCSWFMSDCDPQAFFELM